MIKNKTILVTGGTGYIGSHTVIQLLEAGFSVIVLDNLCNSREDVMVRIKEISGVLPRLIVGDIRDRKCLQKLFSENSIDAVIHFAGLKAVGESESDPLTYYDVNVAGSNTLLQEMSNAQIKTIVFSSSATVYGDPGFPCYREATPLNPINVYGETKLVVENILRDLVSADVNWNVALLRYFNPVGAHASGLIGEDPLGVPNNLMPFIAQVAVGRRDKLLVYGNDYPTFDGTGLRDYIHVDDLASGHLSALNYLWSNGGILTLNLGSGRPYSVLEMIDAFQKESGQSIPYEITNRRPGDLAEYFADPSLANQLLGWEAKHDINRMCKDTWRWQSTNELGFI